MAETALDLRVVLKTDSGSTVVLQQVRTFAAIMVLSDGAVAWQPVDLGEVSAEQLAVFVLKLEQQLLLLRSKQRDTADNEPYPFGTRADDLDDDVHVTPGVRELLGRLLEAQGHPGAADVRAAIAALTPRRQSMGTARGMVDWLCARLDLEPFAPDAGEEECIAWLGQAFAMEFAESSGRDCAYEALNILQVHVDTLAARREGL